MNTSENENMTYTYVCWAIAMISTLGSLFFSEIMKFPPCVLCWYQRIAMYPLAIIFLIGSFQGVRVTLSLATPFAIIGWFIALYHNLLHYEIVPETASPCLQGVSCATVYINWFGFLTIPLLSFMAFSLILLGLFLMKRSNKSER